MEAITSIDYGWPFSKLVFVHVLYMYVQKKGMIIIYIHVTKRGKSD